MKIFLIMTILAYSAKSRVIEENCDGIVINNINDSKEILKNDIDSPYQLVIDYDSNILFFSYSIKNSTPEFESAYINLKTNEFQIIEGINNGFANAVDSQTNTVYLGGSNGLYKFNFETKKAKHIDGTSHNIWQMFFKENLYYSTYPKENIYVFNNGQAEIVPELLQTQARLVACVKNNNIIFANSSGVYVHKKHEDYVSYLGDYYPNCITSDINGNLFFSTVNAIYYINDKNHKIDNLASIDLIYGMAIESDGSIIYSSSDSIVRLKPTKALCFVNEKSYLNLMS